MRLVKLAPRLAAAAAAAALATPAGVASQADALTSGHLAKSAASVSYSVGAISEPSAGCPDTGDISEAVDRTKHYVYQEFEGCDNSNGIGFARSTNGGDSYAVPVALPKSDGGWDPSLAVAPNGTVYAAFMNTFGKLTYPVIDVSHNYGSTFTAEQSLKPAKSTDNWGDADYITVAPSGTLYVAWDYGPSDNEVDLQCDNSDDCFGVAGDFNVVVQSSTNGGQTFTPMSVVNPGYPDAGADMGQIIVAPSGAIDVLYQDYKVTNTKTLKLGPGVEDFVTSANGGKTWSAPVVVGAKAGTQTVDEWWNDVSLSADSSGDLYATWDTQGTSGSTKTDVGWVSFSANGGKTWSAPVQATPDKKNVPHIVEVLGATPREAYVAWLSPSSPQGYALYLRTFSASGAGAWLSGASQISKQFGNPDDDPCDTFGIAGFSPTSLVLSWGSAVPGSGGNPSVFAAPVSVRVG